MGEFSSIQEIITILKGLRVNLVTEEWDLQRQIFIELQLDDRFTFEREYKLGSRSRVDFMITGGVIIEVKKGKPNKAEVIKQLTRYAAYPEVTAIILVVETSLTIPRELLGKPCVSFGLNKLWGIAL
jgi:hypothetical protein